MWHYAQALERVSYERIKASDTFLLYILSTCLLGVLSYFPVDLFFPDDLSDTSRLVPILIAIVAVLLAAAIAGAALFCAVMQNKINKLTSK